jgi:hypothetical protein
MSESEQKEPRILIANPNRFKPAPEPEEKLSDYQKKIKRDQEKKQESRNARLSQGAPYQIPRSKTKSKLLSKDQELALSGINEMNNRKEIADVKSVLDITPSKPVPEGVNPFLPTPMELGLNRSEEKEDVTPTTNQVALDFDVDAESDFGNEFDLDEEVPPNIKRIGGIKRRKSRKLRKSSKKLRKSKRKTTRKVRRHRRRH